MADTGLEGKLRGAFARMVEDYEHLFRHYYPAHDSTGFMEANQVYYYVKNLSDLLGGEKDSRPFAWLEAPLERDGKSTPHADGVVFCPEQKAVVYLEAKRIDQPKAKIKSIYKDVDRLLRKKEVRDNRKYVTGELKFDAERQFLVYLADVWLETPRKKAVPFWWCGYEAPKGLRMGSESKRWKGEKTFVERMRDEGIDWNEDNQLLHHFATMEGLEKVKNYVLMFGYHEIKD